MKKSLEQSRESWECQGWGVGCNLKEDGQGHSRRVGVKVFRTEGTTIAEALLRVEHAWGVWEQKGSQHGRSWVSKGDERRRMARRLVQCVQGWKADHGRPCRPLYGIWLDSGWNREPLQIFKNESDRIWLPFLKEYFGCYQKWSVEGQGES